MKPTVHLLFQPLRFLAQTSGFFLILTALAMAAPDWDDVRFAVKSGIGTENFQLGEPIPATWPKKLGAPNLTLHFPGTGEGLKRYGWGDFKKGQLQKGIVILCVGEGEENAIIDIEIKRVRAGVDKENLFLGLPENTISERSESVQKDGKKSFLLPGLKIETAEGKMVGLAVHSPATTRWRFQHWRIRPGKTVGPIRLGEVFDESLFQTIGEPHERTPKQILWKASDSNQSLRISLEPTRQIVTRVRGVELPWRTPNGATVGDSSSTFSEKHPGAKAGLGRAYQETLLKLPGLRSTFFDEELTTFELYLVPAP